MFYYFFILQIESIQSQLDLHRKGKIAAGRYPQNASKKVLQLLNSVEANAQDKGLNIETLFIESIIPNKASRPWHQGRQRRTKMKRTHLEINVTEKQPKTKETKKQTTKKIETKPLYKILMQKSFC